jgi:hypothetical protein
MTHPELGTQGQEAKKGNKKMRAATLNTKAHLWEQTVPQKEWYSIMEAQVILHMGGPSVRNAYKRGTLTAHKVNGVAHISHENLVAYIAAREGAGAESVDGFVIEEILPTKTSTQGVVAEFLKEPSSETFLEAE